MPIDIPKALIDAGGWVTAAAVCIGVIGAIIHGDLVPGSIHRREIERGDKATAQLERQGEVNEKVASQMDTLLELLGKLLVIRGKP